MVRQALTLFLTAYLTTLLLASASPPRQCSHTCGRFTLPYPLIPGCGVPSLELACTSPGDTPHLRTPSGAFEVLNVSSTSLVIEASSLRTVSCDGKAHAVSAFVLEDSSPYMLSGSNDFFITGCNASGSFTTDLSPRPSSCQTGCHDPSSEPDQRYPFCGKLDCCVLPVPVGVRNISLTGSSSSCSFSSLILPSSFSPNHSSYGLELLWSVPGQLCDSSTDLTLCSPNARCINSSSSSGYNCVCNKGFRGDGYVQGSGCSAADHCSENAAQCSPKASCVNTTCKCPWGYSGDGTLLGGCKLKRSVYLVPAIVGPAFLGVLTYLTWRYKPEWGRKLSLPPYGNNSLKHLKSVFKENARLFPYSELDKATKSFREDLMLGRGSFGCVYKGTLDDNTTVAIKKANNGNGTSIQQFLNEVTILSKVRHTNLVRLLGCCIQREVPILVYEYVPQGTLYMHLQLKGDNLGWERRVRIATETVQALAYLHSAVSPPIYHRDVKSSNILLDDNFTAKVADFGISKLVLPVGATHVSTALHGTPGYIDPQYQQSYQLTDKSDVYSMGVVLLEIITGEMPVDFSRKSADKNLASFAMEFISKGMVEEIIDKKMKLARTPENVASVETVARLAAWCLQFERHSRPSMNTVLEELTMACKTLKV